jgi:hypothetical protein
MDIDAFFEQQLAAWPLARNNFVALHDVLTRDISVDGALYRVQFNPARIVSSRAKVDAASISARPCFLCEHNRPAEQEALPYGSFSILVNPYPIFPRHLTIAATRHTPQRIADHLHTMLELARELPQYTLFYNGARCGASAPDHLHFQAGRRGYMPIETHREGYPYARFITATTAGEAERLFADLYRSLPLAAGDDEPMLNLLCWYADRQWTLCLFPRRKHRPDCYYAEGKARLLSSPAAVDLGGLLILPREGDYRKITADDIRQIIKEVTI